jgi:hypothetical protein
MIEYKDMANSLFYKDLSYKVYGKIQNLSKL